MEEEPQARPSGKSTSLSNMERFAFASPGSPTGDADDDAWHWTRWLFSSRLPRSYALLAHGFDVALVAELDKVDALYARELSVLKSRWQDALQDDFEEAIDTEDEGSSIATEKSKLRQKTSTLSSACIPRWTSRIISGRGLAIVRRRTRATFIGRRRRRDKSLSETIVSSTGRGRARTHRLHGLEFYRFY